MSRNRRKHPRVRAKGVAAHLRTEKGRAACQVENVSAGGVFVRTDRLEQVGTEIFVDLVKPGWKRALTLTARVTSRVDAIDGRLSKRPPGMGLQFLRLDDKQFERLRSLVLELGAPDPGEGITLPDETAEEELRRLDLEAREDATDPIDPPPKLVWQQVQLVEDAIEGALREANVPPPAPLDFSLPDYEPERSASQGHDPEPAAARPQFEKLMFQIRGLVLQLSDAQRQLAQRDAEIQKLRGELETIRGALSRAVRKR
jgi:Tfp pilus assembly protein PilZ